MRQLQARPGVVPRSPALFHEVRISPLHLRFQLCAEDLSCCGRLGPVITRHRLGVDQNTKVLQRFPHRIIRSMRNADPVLTVLLESFDRIRKLSLIINRAAHLQSIIRPLRLNVIRFWVLPPVS